MELISPTTTYTSAAALVFMAAAFLLYQPTGLVRWLQKKNYQYEVTFALYMLTPTEKFIFSKPAPKCPTTPCPEPAHPRADHQHTPLTSPLLPRPQTPSSSSPSPSSPSP